MRRVIAILSAAVLALIVVGADMSKADEQVICSPMSGVLIGPDGAPAAGVAVRREWDYNDKSGSDTVQTDSAGRFAFDAAH